MAEVVAAPELRQTQEGKSVANMLVEFETPGKEVSTSRVKVVGWGKLAEEINQQYRVGDRVVIDGRLQIGLIDMPEGYKEKRAELVASRIVSLGDGAPKSQATAPSPSPKAVQPDPLPYDSGYDVEQDIPF